MKIGILTHHYINNFGAFLQAYALQQAIIDLFPDDDVCIIDDINRKHFIINAGGWFRFYRGKENLSCWSHKIQIPRTFAKARKSHMRLSQRCYGAKDVNLLNLDCIIVGSDEVWNYSESKGNAKIKFGDGLNCEHLVAYAPSVGKTSGNNNLPGYVTNGISRFKAVSARDDLTEQMAAYIREEKIPRVTDPTFLAPIPDEPVPGIQKPYMLFYYCDGLLSGEKEQLFAHAQTSGINVYGAGECDKRYSAITVNLTPFQWAWMFKHAECVITGTFHGVIFSMLNHRRFACYLSNSSRIKKVGSLLSEFGLQWCQTNGRAEQILATLKKKVDYGAFEKIADNKRNESRAFLLKAITNCKKESHDTV